MNIAKQYAQAEQAVHDRALEVARILNALQDKLWEENEELRFDCNIWQFLNGYLHNISVSADGVVVEMDTTIPYEHYETVEALFIPNELLGETVTAEEVEAYYLAVYRKKQAEDKDRLISDTKRLVRLCKDKGLWEEITDEH